MSEEQIIEINENNTEENIAGEELELTHEEEDPTLTPVRLGSIVESILFATDRPQTAAAIKTSFAGYNVTVAEIREAIRVLNEDYEGLTRGLIIEEVAGGYQMRTKPENMQFLKKMVKGRPFKLSGPALEVISIIAYKQPCVKAAVDDIRGVESGHLVRSLMEKGLVSFEGKSELPGKPMLYGTTKKFLEIFGLRNIKELPSLHEIDELLPEGISEQEAKDPTLSEMTGQLSQEVAGSYSQGEEELEKITESLEGITTSSDFFEMEKARLKQEKEDHKAQDIREAMIAGEEVSKRDMNWLERYETKMDEANQSSDEENVEAVEATAEPLDEALAEETVVEADAEEFAMESHSFEGEEVTQTPSDNQNIKEEVLSEEESLQMESHIADLF